MQKTKRVPQNRVMMKYEARQLLSGHVFIAFLVCLIPQILPWISSLFPTDLGIVYVLIADVLPLGLSLPSIALSILVSVFATNPMIVKVCRFFLALNRDSEHLPSPMSVFDCFSSGYLRLMSTTLLRWLIVTVWTAVPVCVGALIPGTWELLVVEDMTVLRITELGYLFLLAAMGLNLYRGLAYSMVPYILADGDALPPRETLAQSVRMTKGRIGELFVLQLSFFGWLLLAYVTFLIGAVYAYPYIETTMASYYLAFKEPMPWEPDLLSDAD